MTGNEILQADMLDILFDNRNKDYGAYRLRKFYANRLILSLGIALGSVLLVFLLFNTESAQSIMAANKDPLVVRTLAVPPEKKKIEAIEPKKKMATSAPAAAQRKFVNRLDIVDDSKPIDDKLIPNTEFNEFTPSDFDMAGVPGTGKKPGPINTSGGSGTSQTEKTNSDVPLITRDPEFPGGIEAWLRFLNKNLRVPGDLEAGEKKTVLIRFEVATDGSVTGFEVVQSGGKYYDEEVIRVLRKMPKWKPALQSSQPVSVAFTQPVTFMGLGD